MKRPIALAGPALPTLALALALAPAPAARAEEGTPPTAAAEEKQLSGMSIIGNDEAPKALVIVPWKTSELGDGVDVGRGLDSGRRPVDREVFARELTYYRIRTAAFGPVAAGPR